MLGPPAGHWYRLGTPVVQEHRRSGPRRGVRVGRGEGLVLRSPVGVLVVSILRVDGAAEGDLGPQDGDVQHAGVGLLPEEPPPVGVLQQEAQRLSGVLGGNGRGVGLGAAAGAIPGGCGAVRP